MGAMRVATHTLALSLLGALALAAGVDVTSGAHTIGPTTLYRRQRSWADYAQPLAVLALARAPTALHYVPGWREGSSPRYLAVGDASGGLLLLSPGGRTLLQHATGTASQVTAVGSYRLSRNTTVLLTGHSSGELRLHLLQHPAVTAASAGAGWEEEEETWAQGQAGAGGGGGSNGGSSTPAAFSLSLSDVFSPQALLCTCTGGQLPGTCAASSAAEEGSAPGGDCPAITAVLGAGRGGMVASIAVVTDAAEGLAVLKHGGPAGAGARIVRRVTLGQQAVALRLPSVGSAAVLGAKGAASQQLSMPQPAKGRQGQHGQQGQDTEEAAAEAAAAGAAAGAAARGSTPPVFKPCHGLNDTRIVDAAFDAQHGNRAFAVSSDGRLLSLVLAGGDRGSLSGCTARASAPLPASLLPVASSSKDSRSGSHGSGSDLGITTVPGYVLVTAGDALAVFNASAGPRHSPRLVLQQPLAALLAQYTTDAHDAPQQAHQAQHGVLLVSSQTHVALTLNATVLALYETALPYRPPQQPYFASMAWLQLFQPAAMILVAAIVLYRARSRRGGGGGGGGGSMLAADPRVREFERLLKDPMAGATARRRPSPGGWDAAGGGSSGGSDEEDSLLGLLPRSVRQDAGGSAGKARAGGLFGRAAARPGGGADSGAGGGNKARDAQRQRAAVLAALDDRETAEMRAELAGGQVSGMEVEEEEEEEGAPQMGDELSQLRRRFTDTHLG